MLNRYVISILCVLFCSDTEGRLPKYQGKIAAEALVNIAWPGEDTIGDYGTREAFINDLIDLIYTNTGRQSLADWMYDRRPGGGVAYGRYKTSILHRIEGDRFTTDSLFGSLLQKIRNADNDNQIINAKFSQLVNLAFPCWTGTLTCYMHNTGSALATEALRENPMKIIEACQWFLGIGGITTDNLPEIIRAKATIKNDLITNNSNLIKTIGVLFSLELIDDWNQLKLIVNNQDLNEPDVPEDYSFLPSVVPIPNTCYNVGGYCKSDCHLNTLKNLVAILCHEHYGEYILNESTKQYFFGKQGTTAYLEHIFGSTSRVEHTTWADSLPNNIKTVITPTFQWLAYALHVLLQENIDFLTWRSTHNTLVTIRNSIEESIRKIHETATVTIEETGGAQWIESQIAITIPNFFRITIKGKLLSGTGTHIEITEITSIGDEE